MLVSGVSLDEFEAIVSRVSAESYGGNVRVHQDAHPNGSRRFTGRIDVRDSRGPGSRTSWTGRHGPYACWHAYRDVLRAVFAANPNARVRTALARYNGLDGFEENYPPTAFHNVGSMMAPAYMPELCECDGNESPSSYRPTITRYSEPRQLDPGWYGSSDAMDYTAPKSSVLVDDTCHLCGRSHVAVSCF